MANDECYNTKCSINNNLNEYREEPNWRWSTQLLKFLKLLFAIKDDTATAPKEKCKFTLMISLVNVSKSVKNCGSIHIC